MFFKIFLISIVLVAIVMLALGVKMLFDPKATFEAHSCTLGEGDDPENCIGCQVKDIANCRKEETAPNVSG
jgi:hypothetical protein